MHQLDRSAIFAYVQAWAAQDTEAARALLSKCWTDESEIIGPGYHVKGLNAVCGEIERFHRKHPGFKAIATSSFDSHGRWTRFTIAMVDPEGKATHEGWDIVEQDDQGKIRKVITFWGALSRPEVWQGPARSAAGGAQDT